MEVTVEYYDENVKAFNPPEWPGGFKAWAESLPKMDRQTPHRMTYSAQYLSLFECSMSPYDNIAHVKAALIKVRGWYDLQLKHVTMIGRAPRS
jgi:hypothetical protein